jgi:hypothetical protein
MASNLDPRNVNPVQPAGLVTDAPEDVVRDPDAADDEARLAGLPDHEVDEDKTVGGGVMSEGGTAVDRGTGTLTGQAQGSPPRDDREEAAAEDRPVDDDDPGTVMPNPQTHG